MLTDFCVFMLSFSYTISLQLSDTLAHITQLRTHILSLPITPKTEAKLTWEGTAIRTWATLALAQYDLPKHHVATILAHPAKPNRATGMILGQRDAYDFIHSSWRANPRPIPVAALETLFTIAYPRSRGFNVIEPALKELIDYLATEEEHPLTQASIAHLYILTLPKLPDPGIFARLIHYLYLSKYGYDLRGYIAPDRVWQADGATYRRLSDTSAKTHTLTAWLEYMAQSMRTNLESIASDIRESRFHIEFPPSFWELSDRQKEILKRMAHPDATVTNRQVQKYFRVSQITASRDLSRLTSLGLLYPHGKGRSVYYTKI